MSSTPTRNIAPSGSPNMRAARSDAEHRLEILDAGGDARGHRPQDPEPEEQAGHADRDAEIDGDRQPLRRDPERRLRRSQKPQGSRATSPKRVLQAATLAVPWASVSSTLQT